MAWIKEIDQTNHALRHQYALHNSDAPILRVTDLTVRYDNQDALHNVTFALPRTTRLAVLGPNGAGKSTLLKVIAGVLSPSSGSVDIFGEEPGKHICIAYVPQRSQVDWNFPVSVRDVVMMGRTGKLGLLRFPGRADARIVDQALETVHLSDLAHRQIGELSGGQQQRMFIARALAQEAELMLMDEPFSGLDVSAQEDILHLLDTLRSQRVTVLVALHDLTMAAEYFEGALLLRHTLIGFGSPREVFSEENLTLAYGTQRAPRQADLPDGARWPLDDDCCGTDGEHFHD